MAAYNLACVIALVSPAILLAGTEAVSIDTVTKQVKNPLVKFSSGNTLDVTGATVIGIAPGGVTSWNTRTGAVVPASGDYTAAQVTDAADITASYANPSWITSLIWSKITNTPTTLSGYGITDAQPLDADLTAIAALVTTSFGRASLTLADGAAFRSYIGAGTSSFNGAFGSLTGTPTTLSGYGITDAQPRDSGLTAIAALTTASFGRGGLTQTSAANFRSYIGAGTSGFSGLYTDLDFTASNLTSIATRNFSSLQGIPTTLSGYGITDAQPLDADLTAIAALTTDAFGRALLTKTDAASIRTYIGAGTSSFDSTFGSLTGTPTTLSGYGITDAVPNTRTVNGHALSSNVTVTPTDLSLVIGTNTEAWDAQLDSLASLSYAGNSLKVIRVNAGETGFELATASGGGGTIASTTNVLQGDGSGNAVASAFVDTGTGHGIFQVDENDPTDFSVTNETNDGSASAGFRLVTDADTALIKKVSGSYAGLDGLNPQDTLVDAGSSGNLHLRGETNVYVSSTGAGIAEIAVFRAAGLSLSAGGHYQINGSQITGSEVGLGNVTNDAQTKSAIVPNTAPSAGKLLVGNAGGTAYAPQTVSGSGATATMSSAGVLTLSAIPNATLSNSAITIAGTSTSLGGSVALDTITGVSSNGFLKRTGTNTLTSDSSTYLTGNQTITFSGDVTGSGATAITTTNVNLPDGVTQAGSLVVTDIAAPTSPAASHLKIFGDSTDLRFHDKNAAGTIGTTVVADTGATNNFLTAVSAAGAISRARPTFANLTSTPTTLSGYGITDAQGLDTQLTSLAALSYTGNSLKTIRVNAGETDFELSSAGAGTVTNTGGNLTSNSVVLGAGTADTKVVSGIITDGTSCLTLGVNTTTLGKVKMFGNTSGDATVQPAATAGTATVVTLPNASSTLPIFGQQITFSGPSAARTVTFPDANFTAARTDAANTFTGHQTIEGTATAGATGSGNLVFASAPTLTNPAVGTQSANDNSTKAASTAYVDGGSTNHGGWSSVWVASSDFTTTNLTATTITGLTTGTLSNSTMYEFQATLKTASSSAAGIKYAITGAGGGTAATCWSAGNSFGGNTVGLGVVAIDTLSQAFNTGSSDGAANIAGFVTTRSTGTATFSLQMAKVTSGTATCYVGSVLRYRIAGQ